MDERDRGRQAEGWRRTDEEKEGEMGDRKVKEKKGSECNRERDGGRDTVMRETKYNGMMGRERKMEREG